MSLALAIDCAYPFDFTKRPSGCQIILGYVATEGDTPHVWTFAEVAAARATGCQWWPIGHGTKRGVAATAQDGHDLAALMIARLPWYGVTKTTPVFQDMEPSTRDADPAGAAACVAAWKADMNAAGYVHAYTYCTESPFTDWLANWTNVRPTSLPKGKIGWQYGGAPAYDLSVFDAALLTYAGGAAVIYPGATWRPIPDRTNGPFPPGGIYGIVLHVNDVDAAGDLSMYNWFSGPNNVCSHFQVMKSGAVEQYVDTAWTTWCQGDGNAHYLSVETQGLAADLMNPDQVEACAHLLAWCNTAHGIPLQLAELPDIDHGFGWHGMGAAHGQPGWGHAFCPGVRKDQRQQVLDRAAVIVQGGDDMSQADVDAINAHMDFRATVLENNIKNVLNLAKGLIQGNIAALPTADQIADAVIAKLPSNPNGTGPTLDQINKAIRDALDTPHAWPTS